MTYQTLEVEREGAVAIVTVNRPDKRNALNRVVREELIEALAALQLDSSVRVLLLTGAGDRAFVAGADISEFAERTPLEQRQAMTTIQTFEAVAACTKPVIAMINGYALGGGCELALACDLILASEKAQFGLPEVDLAVLPGWGGSQRLERRVGYGRARDMILTGRRVRAEEAHSWGLCDRVFPPERLRDEAVILAKGLAAKDAEALAAAKRALRWRSELPLSETLRLETDAFVELFQRPERQAAMERFLKRS